MLWTKREKLILQILKKIPPSFSHGIDHLQNVAQYANALTKKYHGQRDLVVPAALLHDLGRNNPRLHGLESVHLSIRLAKPILKKTGYSPKEIELILQIISDHDQPGLSPKLLESRILKDADFLDGFGIRGILRAVYFTAEAGQPISKAIERLTIRMTARYQSLEFPESKNLAQEQYSLTQLLFSYLKFESDLGKKTYKGKFIVLEGISGTGKETQAKLLAEYLRARGQPCEIVYHPTPLMKEILRLWRAEKGDLFAETFFFIADRHNVVQKKLLPALKAGKIVISLRSYISTLVYQAKNPWQQKLIEYLYSVFDPRPDAIFYFDLKPETALARIEKRTKDTGEIKGKFEKLEALKEKLNKYQRALEKFENVITLDAKKSVDEVHKNIVHSLRNLWQKEEN